MEVVGRKRIIIATNTTNNLNSLITLTVDELEENEDYTFRIIVSNIVGNNNDHDNCS